MPSFSMAAAIDIDDRRLVMGLAGGSACVALWGILNVFWHAEYFLYQPIAPVAQGGVAAASLPWDAGSACAQAQNSHCERANCTVLTPDELLAGGTVYQDRLYVTTKIDVVSHVKTCVGTVQQGLCIGTVSEAEAERLTVYTAGLEGLALSNNHASKDPTSEDAEVHAVHHCDLSGGMAMGAIASGPCADATTQLAFAGGRGTAGTCFEGDRVTVGQLLRAADLDAEEPERLVGAHGELKEEVRDSGAVVHVKIVYGNTPSDTTVTYEYQAGVIDRDAFATAKRELADAGEWSEGAAGVWTRDETVQLRQGLIFTFSQEGMVGASNLNTLVVHLMAVHSLMGLVGTVLTVVAQRVLKYEDKVRPPTLWNAHFSTVAEPTGKREEKARNSRLKRVRIADLLLMGRYSLSRLWTAKRRWTYGKATGTGAWTRLTCPIAKKAR